MERGSPLPPLRMRDESMNPVAVALPRSFDGLLYYDLEHYLFEVVNKRFHTDGEIGAFDLISIVVWKANRSKSKFARRLRSGQREHLTLDEASRQFTRELAQCSDAQARLALATSEQPWGFGLPTATAILTVLWPDEFTVYDYRACEQLGQFEGLASRWKPSLWSEYVAYRDAVIASVPEATTLRDKDRILWGRSDGKQLMTEIAKNFERDESPPASSTA